MSDIILVPWTFLSKVHECWHSDGEVAAPEEWSSLWTPFFLLARDPTNAYLGLPMAHRRRKARGTYRYLPTYLPTTYYLLPTFLPACLPAYLALRATLPKIQKRRTKRRQGQGLGQGQGQGQGGGGGGGGEHSVPPTGRPVGHIRIYWVNFNIPYL